MGALSAPRELPRWPDLIALVDRLLDAMPPRARGADRGLCSCDSDRKWIGNLLNVPRRNAPRCGWSLAILGALDR